MVCSAQFLTTQVCIHTCVYKCDGREKVETYRCSLQTNVPRTAWNPRVALTPKDKYSKQCRNEKTVWQHIGSAGNVVIWNNKHR